MDTGLDSLKTTSKKVVYKTGGFLGNFENKTCWRNNYSAREKRRNIKRIKTSIIKMEHYKIPKLLNNSSILRFVTKNVSK